MLAQVLIAFGAALMGLLCTIHIVYTFFTNKFEARDPATSVAMKATSPVLTRRTSLWDAWIGFTASPWSGPVAVRRDLSVAGGRSRVFAAPLACPDLAACCRRRSISGNRPPILVPQSIHWCCHCHSVLPDGRIHAFPLRGVRHAV